MLVFVDESGDTGLQFGAGSSPYFTVTLVIFEDHDEAQAADDRIGLLRRELGMPENFEFHFMDHHDSIRDAFFDAVAPYNFFYFSIVINKARLTGPGFKYKNSFYKYVCGLIFENAKPHLDNAIVKIDESGNRAFKQELQAYLKKRINDKNSAQKYIRKIALQDSRGNNLVQLADMVCGAVARSYKKKDGARVKNADRWRKKIRHREFSVQFWPH